jgi:AcrR family transcriptional regulator
MHNLKKSEIEQTPVDHGLRARGKRERRRRLREAARAVFLERGYERATTREIAARADVSVGTLFVYAPEKRDLLFLVSNDDLDAIVSSAVLEISHKQPVLEQLLSIFRPVYDYFERHVVIGRYGMPEILLMQVDRVETLGPEAKRVIDRRHKLLQAIAQVVDRARKGKRLSTPERGDEIAELLLWLHWCNVQSWISVKSPKAELGLKRLKRLFNTVIKGLGPKEG